jgi:hypothetical protein
VHGSLTSCRQMPTERPSGAGVVGQG